MRAGWRTTHIRLLCRRPASAKRPVALVNASEQRIYIVAGMRLLASYPVSTSRFGVGTRNGSFRTPTGAHRVIEKIGEGAPLMTVFKARRNTGKLAAVNGQTDDAICSRVLWLDGLEPGHNRGGARDSRRRHIYIHGTADEANIGRPVSRGCIRMKNADVCEVFDALEDGSVVYIFGGEGT